MFKKRPRPLFSHANASLLHNMSKENKFRISVWLQGKDSYKQEDTVDQQKAAAQISALCNKHNLKISMQIQKRVGDSFEDAQNISLFTNDLGHEVQTKETEEIEDEIFQI